METNNLIRNLNNHDFLCRGIDIIDHVLIEIEIEYTDLNKEKDSEKDLEIYKHSARLYIPKNKIVNTFVQEELEKTGGNYMKIELKAKKNKICLESLINCFEYMIDKNYDLHYNKDNIISYFYAFSVCKLFEKRNEVLEKLLHDLTDENIIYFLKVVSTLDDDFLNSYSFWMIRYLINKNEKLSTIEYSNYKYENIIKVNSGFFSFDNNRIIYNNNKFSNLSININFVKKYFQSIIEENKKYYICNNYFNMGKVLRKKSDQNLVDDYPHYYQLLLENDPSIMMYAIRPSENANFIISKSIDDFSKYSLNFIAEVVSNFWGTHFEIYDFGYEKNLYDKIPKSVGTLREKMGEISYETNIMGECPRYFKIDLLQDSSPHRLVNLKPEWNKDMDCYCLNFYGRVKKASAKNFQIVYEDDNDNILLQHGKVSKDEYNIDFREPFNFVNAFAVSLVSIGKKRVVS